MQHHEISWLRHQENGGAASAANNRPSSLRDRLLLPMFSMGFSSNDQKNAVDGRIGFSIKEGCIKLNNHNNILEKEEEEACSKNFDKNGENPNLNSKKRESGQKKSCSRGHWKPSEDAKLRELVAIYGPQNWNVIAEKLQGRSGKSCRLRWYNQLDPKINKKAFTEEEEERLIEAHRVYGNKWAFISRLFPGRTDNSVKNHWHVFMARKCREKSKYYVKTKWNSISQPILDEKSMQLEIAYNINSLSNVSRVHNQYGEQVFVSNYPNSYSAGKPCNSPVSTSQISFATPSSPSPLAADQYRESAANFSETPTFIDFLGVGDV